MLIWDSNVFVSLDLRGGGRKKVNVHGITVVVSTERSKVGGDVGTVRGLRRKAMRW